MGEAKNREEAKKALFEKEPENFAHTSELVLAIRETADGHLENFVNMAKGSKIQLAVGILMCEAPTMFQMWKYQKEQENAKGIITPGGNGKSRIKI